MYHVVEIHTCTIGMIVNVSAQMLPRNGIWVSPAISWSAFAAAKAYLRILSAVVVEVGGITNLGFSVPLQL
jgi:hypothetical protein